MSAPHGGGVGVDVGGDTRSLLASAFLRISLALHYLSMRLKAAWCDVASSVGASTILGGYFLPRETSVALHSHGFTKRSATGAATQVRLFVLSLFAPARA